MHERVLIAGSGGQGVILLGKLLASVALDKVEHVTFFPAYGAEVRGGTSNCQVVFSSSEIASPVSEAFDSMIIMNRSSLDKFLSMRAGDGPVVVNRSLCGNLPDGANLVGVSASEVAAEMGDIRVANLVMLGAYVAAHPNLPLGNVESGIGQLLAGKSQRLLELNLKAYRKGLAG